MARSAIAETANMTTRSTPLAHPPKALAFDIFGTVVDWHGGIATEAAAMAAKHGISGDWNAFATAWRDGYYPAMDRVRRGELPWTLIDGLHRMILDDIAEAHGLGVLNEADRAHLNHAWHRLMPWPDVVPGLLRLKRTYTISTLSNGNFSLLTDMAKHAGLPWDCIISAELFGHYKPDREAYHGCARLLGIEPGELMLVACHPSDLRGAKSHGLRTAYVKRPKEEGPDGVLPAFAEGEFDLVADDFAQLAGMLHA